MEVSKINGYDIKDKKAVRTYDNVVLMKSDTSLKEGQHVKTRGYYEVNDNGSSEYYITNTQNLTEYQELLSNGLYANLVINNDSVNIKQFGAKGDNVTNDTTAFQNALNYITNSNITTLNLNKDETYMTNTLRIYKDTEINLNESKIISLDTHLFFNFNSTDTYTEYNGNGNIYIHNGTIQGGGISFIHGKNILIENIEFINNNNDHYLEICACSDYQVLNCLFKGLTEQESNRQNVEYIQIDKCDRQSFPWLTEENITYDDTVNENITIKNCKFIKSDNETYNNLYTAIGSHVLPTEHHKNINIIDNYISDCANNSIRLWRVEGITIKGNVIVNPNDNAISLYNSCSNVVIENNKISNIADTQTGILVGEHSNRYSNIVVKNNIILGLNEAYSNKAINIGSTDDCIISNNVTNHKSPVAVNNSTDCVISNNISYNTNSDTSRLVNITGTCTFKYTDKPVNLATNTTTGLNTLNFDITQFNKIILECGYMNSSNYREIIIKSYETRNFQLDETYTFYDIASDGSVNIYTMVIDSSDATKITISNTSNISLGIRKILGLRCN